MRQIRLWLFRRFLVLMLDALPSGPPKDRLVAALVSWGKIELKIAESRKKAA